MENFHLSMPTNIYFGHGMVKKLTKHLNQYKRILLVAGGGSIKKNGVYEQVRAVLDSMQIKVFELWGVQPNPDIESVREGIKICKDNDIEFILAVGGGSVIDASKAIAAGFYFKDDPWLLFYDETKVKKALPIGVILTLPATGSETNGNAVVSNREKQEKLSIHSDLLKPVFAILDPYYTFSLPQSQTAAGSADILAHLFEQYFSKNLDNYLIDRMTEAVMKTVIKYAPIAIKEPENLAAREQLMYASTLALNGLLSSGKVTDWATHALEHEVSATHDVTHGVGLAILFPRWMKYCYSDDKAIKYVEYAVNVWEIKKEDFNFIDFNQVFEKLSKEERKSIAFEAIEKTAQFFKSLGLPDSFRSLNIDPSYSKIWASNLIKRDKSAGNFKVLYEEDIKQIYESCFE
ncbi:MAG: iron-containing alcohol dehydrogenase [Spirochaetes bacterium]|jgi:alcohol dehydrogenase YqhD (iron-dependent ADH family)|nr:iron-containing alcohol dehydrogenase [Spirochaetota bacterium]NLJ05938.1 iron-containing alcohol dehydrogenase [Exilispira sp.]MBP8990616.1 iron-containing alcohol dehydrogenase [Spirochaetota bacterium]HNV43300.1 iron-containing alcohol dehydrogenase [Exilispira sp.]HOV45789.1 iron-containing alcohol dehydrogenase [Exilispira sp.]